MVRHRKTKKSPHRVGLKGVKPKKYQLRSPTREARLHENHSASQKNNYLFTHCGTPVTACYLAARAALLSGRALRNACLTGHLKIKRAPLSPGLWLTSTLPPCQKAIR